MLETPRIQCDLYLLSHIDSKVGNEYAVLLGQSSSDSY